jgi:hypothetical protein
MAGRRRTGEAPALRHHKASGRAYVTYLGQQTYLGLWNSPEARRAYRDWVSAWESANRPDTAPRRVGASITVADLVAAHAEYAARHYRRADGSPTDEVRAFVLSLRPLVAAHADRNVEDIGGRDLAAIVRGWKHRRERR